MKQYEYDVRIINSEECDTIKNILNEYGKNGWKLIDIKPAENCSFLFETPITRYIARSVYFFIREIDNSKEQNLTE